MSVAEYLRILRSRWLTIVALSVLCTLGAALYAWSQTPTYSASAQVFVNIRSGTDDISSLTQGGTFTQQRVKTYTQIISAPELLQPVIDRLRLGGTPEGLAKQITATSPLDTVLIDIGVVDTSPIRARDIANGVATQFTLYVPKLEMPSGQSQSLVSPTVTQPAVLPITPESPRRGLDIVVGLLLGLALGAGTAVLRDGFDRTIGGRNEAGAIAGSPILAAIGDDPLVRESPLIIHNSFSPRAEAFRQLRTNIRFLSIDHRVRSLVVTSSVESEGKTTTACNLAIALAQSGERVVLIDADLRRPTIVDVFGLSNGVGLTSVLLGDVPLSDALQEWRRDLPLFLLASGPIPPNPSELIGSQSMVDILTSLVSDGYTVVVDSPPLLPVTDAAILARVTDGALVVARVGATRTDQLAGAVENLATAGAPVLGVVLNRIPRLGGKQGHYGRYGYSPGPNAGYAPRSMGDTADDTGHAMRTQADGPSSVRPETRPGTGERSSRSAR